MSTKLPAFPPNVLTGAIADFVRIVGPTTEAPDALLLGAALAAFSVLLGRDASLSFSSTGTLFPNMLVGLLGETASSRKSTAIDAAIDLLVKPMLPPRLGPNGPSMIEIIVGMGSGEGFLDAIADKEWKPPGTTSTQVVSGRRALFAIHELSELFGKVKRDQAGGMVDFLLRAFDAPSIWTARTKAGAQTATNATAVIIAGATLSGLSDTMSRSLISGGLANRFLWVAGQRKGPLPLPPAPDAAAIAELRTHVAASIGAVRGHSFQLDDAAKRLHSALYMRSYARAEESDDKSQFTRREDVHALKVAMIFAASEGKTTITEYHLDAAWAVIDHARDVVKVLLEAAPPRTMADAEDRVRGAAQRLASKNGGTFTQREVYQNVKGRRGLDFKTTSDAFNALVAAEEFVVVSGTSDTFVIASSSGAGATT